MAATSGGDTGGDALAGPTGVPAPPPASPPANPGEPLSLSEDPLSLAVSEPTSPSLQPRERQIGLCVAGSPAFWKSGGSGSGGGGGGSSAVDPPEKPVVSGAEPLTFITKMTAPYLEDVTRGISTKVSSGFEAIDAAAQIIEKPTVSTFVSVGAKAVLGLLEEAYIVTPAVEFVGAIAITALGSASAIPLAAAAPIAITAGVALDVAFSIGNDIGVDQYAIPKATEAINRAISDFQFGLGQLERDISALYQYNGPRPP